MPTIEIKKYDSPDQGEINALFIDGEFFDWGIDPESMKEAIEFTGSNTTLRKGVHGDVQAHFLDSLSLVLKRPITIRELNEAIERGQID